MIGDHAEHGNDQRAEEDLALAHLLGAVRERDIADAGQHHRGHGAESGADGAEDRQGGTLFIVRGDDLRERPVRDVDAGVQHAEQDVGHIDPGKASGRAEAAHIQEHQHGGPGHRDREELDEPAVTAVLCRLRAVDDAAPDRVVDGIPDTGYDGHDHDA